MTDPAGGGLRCHPPDPLKEAVISKALKTVGMIAGAVALTLAILGVGAAIGASIGVSAGTVGTIATIANSPTPATAIGTLLSSTTRPTRTEEHHDPADWLMPRDG